MGKAGIQVTIATTVCRGRNTVSVQLIKPFLWYDGQAEEATNYYTSIFPNSRVVKVSRYGEGAPLPAGTVMTIEFELDGQPFIALNGGPHFKFNEAVSFVVTCQNQNEIDHYWQKLTAGGAEVQCGWLKDKFGLSWQIVPAVLAQLMGGNDPARAARVMQALMQMTKLDIAGLQKAYDNA